MQDEVKLASGILIFAGSEVNQPDVILDIEIVLVGFSQDAAGLLEQSQRYPIILRIKAAHGCRKGFIVGMRGIDIYRRRGICLFKCDRQRGRQHNIADQ